MLNSWNRHPNRVDWCWGTRWEVSAEEFGLCAFFQLLILMPYINRAQCRSCTIFCRCERKIKKRHSLCFWDVCSLTEQFHSPILYASWLLTAFTSSPSSLNWESRDKTRHCDNGILCCDLWLHFPFKPQYFTLWIIMFFVGKIRNLKTLQMAFHQELWLAK